LQLTRIPSIGERKQCREIWVSVRRVVRELIGRHHDHCQNDGDRNENSETTI
jgi:hypothetical protein